MFTSETIHPTLLMACESLVSKRGVKKTPIKKEKYDSSFIPMSEDDLYEMFINEDLYDKDEPEEEVEEKPKKKKKKVQLSEAELEEKKKAKEEEKERKRAMKEARAEAERIRKQQKEERKAAEMKQHAEVAVIELIARKEYLLNKLDTIDINKKKSAAKVAAINIELRDINNELNRLKREFNIDIEDINEGSKVKRFFGRARHKVHKACKKTKKFFKRNSELIIGLSSVLLPFVGGIIYKMVTK